MQVIAGVLAVVSTVSLSVSLSAALHHDDLSDSNRFETACLILSTFCIPLLVLFAFCIAIFGV